LYGEPTYQESPAFGIPMLCQVPYDPPPLPDSYQTNLGRHTALLWNKSESQLGMKGSIELQRKSRIAAYQSASRNRDDGEDMKQLSDSLKWRLNQWDAKQRTEHKVVMKRAHELMLERTNMREAIDLYEKK
jgi:hypothetical protein